MKLSEKLGQLYAEEFQKEIDLEMLNHEYLPQSAFKDCKSRGRAGTIPAKERVDNFLGLVILNHRKKEHNEQYNNEEVTLMAVMPEEDISAASTQEWWVN